MLNATKKGFWSIKTLRSTMNLRAFYCRVSNSQAVATMIEGLWRCLLNSPLWWEEGPPHLSSPIHRCLAACATAAWTSRARLRKSVANLEGDKKKKKRFKNKSTTSDSTTGGIVAAVCLRLERGGQNNTGVLTTIRSSTACGSWITHSTLNLLFSPLRHPSADRPAKKDSTSLSFTSAWVWAAAWTLCKPTFHCSVVCFDIFKQPVPIHLGTENSFGSV